MLLVRGRGGVVERLAEREAERGRSPVDHRRGERQRVDVDAALVHLLDAFGHHDKSFVERVGDALRLEVVLAVFPLQGSALLRAVLLEQADPFFRVPVGVDVDGLHLAIVAAPIRIRGGMRGHFTLLLGGVLLCGTAAADDQFGAIAYSSEARVYGLSRDRNTPGDAETGAPALCSARAGGCGAV